MSEFRKGLSREQLFPAHFYKYATEPIGRLNRLQTHLTQKNLEDIEI